MVQLYPEHCLLSPSVRSLLSVADIPNYLAIMNRCATFVSIILIGIGMYLITFCILRDCNERQKSCQFLRSDWTYGTQQAWCFCIDALYCPEKDSFGTYLTCRYITLYVYFMVDLLYRPQSQSCLSEKLCLWCFANEASLTANCYLRQQHRTGPSPLVSYETRFDQTTTVYTIQLTWNNQTIFRNKLSIQLYHWVKVRWR